MCLCVARMTACALRAPCAYAWAVMVFICRGTFFQIFLAFILKCSHFVVVATNICYNIPESHSFAHAKWYTLAHIPTHTEGRFYARFNISTDKFDSISQLNWLRVDAAAASF